MAQGYDEGPCPAVDGYPKARGVSKDEVMGLYQCNPIRALGPQHQPFMIISGVVLVFRQDNETKKTIGMPSMIPILILIGVGS